MADRSSPRGVVGRTYLERGRPVVVLAQWRSAKGPLPPHPKRGFEIVLAGRHRAGPRNVLIRRESGELVIRPFRGLRRAVEEVARG